MSDPKRISALLARPGDEFFALGILDALNAYSHSITLTWVTNGEADCPDTASSLRTYLNHSAEAMAWLGYRDHQIKALGFLESVIRLSLIDEYSRDPTTILYHMNEMESRILETLVMQRPEQVLVPGFEGSSMTNDLVHLLTWRALKRYIAETREPAELFEFPTRHKREVAPDSGVFSIGIGVFAYEEVPMHELPWVYDIDLASGLSTGYIKHDYLESVKSDITAFYPGQGFATMLRMCDPRIEEVRRVGLFDHDRYQKPPFMKHPLYYDELLEAYQDKGRYAYRMTFAHFLQVMESYITNASLLRAKK
ncbi:hypothetical protein JXB02_06045 [Candidatus Woesearchaeota archaeon]|nr:hypothetical protein [Candidatus Woesearchaeota archaeon]